MNRRRFLLSLLSVPLALRIPKSKLAIDKLWRPSPSQLAFYEREDPIHLLGIPYHENDATSATWCGIDRSTPETQKAILEMIRVLQKDHSWDT